MESGADCGAMEGRTSRQRTELFDALPAHQARVIARDQRKRTPAPPREAKGEALKDKPIKSLSLDNGSEFAEFRELEEQLKAPVYFAEPHKPWQRGCNENANGLLRYFFPRGCNFLDVSQAEFERVLDLIKGPSQILCKLQMKREQIRIQCARQRIYPTAALCAV